MVRKANGKWRMCIDFIDLNKACLKDKFPLPRIDSLVDATTTSELMSEREICLWAISKYFGDRVPTRVLECKSTPMDGQVANHE
jgi:hypothetical protein